MAGNVTVACDDGGGERVGKSAADAAERLPAEEEECEEDVAADEATRTSVILVLLVFVS